MKTVLSISSQTVAGMVGNRVSQFVLQRMGIRVLAVPTALNSNHGGHPNTHSEPVSAEALEALIGNLADNGWLDEVDAVLTGYLASPDHVEIMARWIRRLKSKNPALLYFCDPILGDDAPPGYDPESGGIYVAEAIAEGIRAKLVPLADIVSPNRFELEYLSDRPVRSESDAQEAGGALKAKTVLATSVPCDEGLAVMAIAGDKVAVFRHEALDPVPKGTGDVIAAAFLGATLRGRPLDAALRFAGSATLELCRVSVGAEELRLIEYQYLLDGA